MRPLKLTDIQTALSAELIGEDVIFERVNTDTRDILTGDLFVALKGERFDAHEFAESAADAGAAALVVERIIPGLKVPQLKVQDTTRALGEIAHLSRLQFEGPLVALTGSCGKTTVKEMMTAVLGRQGQVHATRGNLNNHIGVPQTLLAMPATTEFAVIEMGASGLGEIDYLASVAEPTVALVNNVMAAHLEGFGSEAGVAAEKSSIYRHLRDHGVAVVNLDVPYASGWLQSLAQVRPDVRCLTFSDCLGGADLRATDIQLNEKGCYSFELQAAPGSVHISLPIMGRQNVNNALAVAGCCLAVGLDLPDIALGLASVAPVKGRLKPVPGINRSLVIDDTYNANPGSVKAAAQVLMDLKQHGRDVVLVLGDLGELGEDEAQVLDQLGQDLGALGVPQLLTQGLNSVNVHKGFRATAGEYSKAKHFESQGELNQFLTNQLTDETVVLVKGSRSARMEGVVQAIMLDGEHQ
ncbi:UDP-N-acetylmuramoyl-tripeptide--D-alanyl-D-alanine ligase [Aestuariicella hydrocarbonica]|uniref:UDP-N-acetylmuramoyl-tripeptide--D-alanyl-D-alanine ligase n=1 Tax=Pseudomaricurvus hydrocarbonicus TaxID=1470433 RepID=A0A9E5MGS5_9GAMM|nr:UDP-N-acetylmuramoyl-tripeptide--D-alanyl-D-alanine ligase [Aestuariicella hydrocarbonica]